MAGEIAIGRRTAQLSLAWREAAELYHELLEHRWYQSQRKGRDVGRDEALRSYVDLLRSLPDERRAILSDDV